jgi:steroid delta-isomerase-like uncharacterized protein
MSTTVNQAVVGRFIEEVLGGGNFATLNALAAPDCVDHAAAPGPAAVAQFLVSWRAAFPDLAITTEDLIAAGDRVAARWTLCGTHRGAFLGLPPTGRPVAVAATEFYRLAEGQIVERWAAMDTAGLRRQLRAPTPSVPLHERGRGWASAGV